MSKILSIGTAVPAFRHRQEDVLKFMQNATGASDTEKRIMRFLYHQGGIETRHSVIGDYSRPLPEWKFYPHSESLEPFPSLEQRMGWYQRHAAPLSMDAIRHCLEGHGRSADITHLITVSCTGMSAPGLDLELMELLELPHHVYRTSVNFMGCYAAIHALKIADGICHRDPNARVLVVCTELCTLHFQRDNTADNIASGLLFADGSAAVLVSGDDHPEPGLCLEDFYSEVIPRGKKDMSWELSSSGFQMTLSGYVPELLGEDFEPLIERALSHASLRREAITHWCIHPGGKKILEAVSRSLHLPEGSLKAGYEVLREYGNMSSPTLLFVLKKIMHSLQHGSVQENQRVLAAAFGPGITMETFIASYRP